MISPNKLFDLSEFSHVKLFNNKEWVWTTLTKLKAYLYEILAPELVIHGTIGKTTTLLGTHIYIGEGTQVEDGVTIMGPAYIGNNCEIRQGAYMRGNSLLGDRCVLGHASEIKNSIMLNDAKAPHFAYVGDSILGNNTNLGAGTKLSNLTVSSEKDLESGIRPTIILDLEGEKRDTGLAKMGAIIGDRSQTGCNVVTNPGTIIGKDTLIYPNTSVPKGYLPNRSIVKLHQQLDIVPRR